MSHPPRHTIDLPNRPGRWHVRRHPTDPWVEVEVVEVDNETRALGFEAWGSRCGWEHSVLAGFQWGGKVAPKITFSMDNDEDAKRAAAVLHSLGFDAERVDGETRAPVGLTLAEMRKIYGLGDRELAIVGAVAGGARTDVEINEVIKLDPKTVVWLRRVVETKTGHLVADLPGLLRTGLHMCADGIGCDAPGYDEPMYACKLCGVEPPPIHGYG